MPAPTAQIKPTAAPEATPLPAEEQGDELILDVQDINLTDAVGAVPPVESLEDTEMAVDEEGRPRFTPGRDVDPVRRPETRKVPIPPNRMSALKSNWSKVRGLVF
jgi:RNA-binding protein PNO1